jgi:ABC-type transport system involved in multi-copper enzyme maturation permease subunit
VLYPTALKPFEILTGKRCSSLAMVTSIAILAMPVTAICALSGGISVPLLLKTYAIVLLAIVTYGVLGLTISAICSRSFTAVVSTYVMIAVLAGGTWLPSVLLGSMGGLTTVWMLLRSLSPFEALFALNHPSRYEIYLGGTAIAGTTFQFYVGGMLLLTALLFVLFCYFILRPLRSRKARQQQQYTDIRTTLKRKLVFPFYLIDPLKRKRPIALWRNPVFVAELRSKIFGKPKFIIRALATCITLSMGILILIAFNFATVLGPDHVRFVAVVFQFGLIVLVAPLVSSGSITEERNSGTMLLLRITPVSAWTMVMGKMKAAFMYVLIFLISSLPVLFALTYLETEAAYWRIGAWVITLLLSALVFTLGGLFASTFMSTTAAATALSYTFAFALSVVTLSVLLFGERISATVQTVFLTLNPLVAAIQITSDEWFAEYPMLFGNAIWKNHLYLFSALAVCMLVVAAIRVRQIFHERI